MRIKKNAGEGRCLQCAGGSLDHMPPSELLEPTVRNYCNLSCPVCGPILCGFVHLSREEIEQFENQKIIYSERRQQIRQQAERLDSAQQQGVVT